NEEKLIELFGHNFFSLRHILNYAQRAMVNKLLEIDTARIEESLSNIVNDYYGLFEYLATLNVKAPPIISSAAGIALTHNVVSILKEDITDPEALRAHMKRSRQWNVALSNQQIEHELQAWVIKQMRAIYESPSSAARMDLVKDVIALFTSEFYVYLDLYEAQNFYYAAQMEIVRRLKQITPDARASWSTKDPFFT
ncbi:MAG: hypothetical protein FWF96_06985, partial [Kiritimatiellaeota bacterium]|nr:hypothetical protein [Kiritimatiellota bacterium]